MNLVACRALRKVWIWSNGSGSTGQTEGRGVLKGSGYLGEVNLPLLDLYKIYELFRQGAATGHCKFKCQVVTCCWDSDRK